MGFQLDTGNQGSEGPWIAWSARGTQDGTIPAKSFYLRDGDSKQPFAGFDRGVVFDIYAMKTGWQKSDGVLGQAPEWKWNASVSNMQPQPGDDFKKGFSVPCAISKEDKATWEQAGAAVWSALTDLAEAFSKAPEGKLPVIKMVDTKLHQFKRGSTVQPVLVVDKWVDRPDALKEGAAAGIADEPAPQQAQPAQAAPAQQAAMADDAF